MIRSIQIDNLFVRTSKDFPHNTKNRPTKAVSHRDLHGFE